MEVLCQMQNKNGTLKYLGIHKWFVIYPKALPILSAYLKINWKWSFQ